MTEFGNVLLGSTISNFIFVSLFAVGAFIKSRMKNSDCDLNVGFFSCHSSLEQLEQLKKTIDRTQSKQNSMLHEIIIQQKKQEVMEPKLVT